MKTSQILISFQWGRNCEPGSKGNDAGVKPWNESQSFHADISHMDSHMAYSTTTSPFLSWGVFQKTKLNLSANIDRQIMLKHVQIQWIWFLSMKWYRTVNINIGWLLWLRLGWLSLKQLLNSPGQSDDDNLLTFICFQTERLGGSRCKNAPIMTGVSHYISTIYNQKNHPSVPCGFTNPFIKQTALGGVETHNRNNTDSCK